MVVRRLASILCAILLLVCLAGWGVNCTAWGHQNLHSCRVFTITRGGRDYTLWATINDGRLMLQLQATRPTDIEV